MKEQYKEGTTAGGLGKLKKSTNNSPHKVSKRNQLNPVRLTWISDLQTGKRINSQSFWLLQQQYKMSTVTVWFENAKSNTRLNNKIKHNGSKLLMRMKAPYANRNISPVLVFVSTFINLLLASLGSLILQQALVIASDNSTEFGSEIGGNRCVLNSVIQYLVFFF